MKLYDYLPSGNGYKVRLLLAQLGHRFTLIEKDITKGETRTPDFLALNPNGRIPVLELDDGRHLSESDAILFYLAEGTPFLPAERFARADVLRWMFFEQYSHEPYIAVARASSARARVGASASTASSVTRRVAGSRPMRSHSRRSTASFRGSSASA